MIEPSERCIGCFALLDGKEKHCGECRFSFRCAAPFEFWGPAAALVSEFKYSGRFQLAAPMAGYMALQLERLGWPLPDLVVPVPISLTHLLKRGYNQSGLLAQELSRIIDRPCVSLLKRRSGHFSQSGQDRSQRLKLSSEEFSWKKRHPIADKTILLIDDVTTTKSTLIACAEQLQACFPARLYALTFCIA
jgi:ComF family protein